MGISVRHATLGVHDFSGLGDVAQDAFGVADSLRHAFRVEEMAGYGGGCIVQRTCDAAEEKQDGGERSIYGRRVGDSGKTPVTDVIDRREYKIADRRARRL